MPQWFDLDKEEQEAVLARIAGALKAKKLPHLDDSVLFEQSVLIYHDKENDDDPGYRLRVTKSEGSSLPKLGEEALYNQVMIVANCLLSRKKPPESMRADFSKRLLAYLDRKIPRAKLLGNRRSNTFIPQFRYFIGGLANFARNNIRRNSNMGRRRLPEELSMQKDDGGLFELLAELASGAKISDLVGGFCLVGEATATLKTIRLKLRKEEKQIKVTPAEINSMKNTHTWAQCYAAWKKRQAELDEYLERQERLKKNLSKLCKSDSPN
jgi:hypothetical protein